MSSLSILYCGDLRKGGTCLHRMQALKELGHDIASVDTAPEDVRNRQRRFSYLVRRKLFGPLDLAKANKQIVSKLKQRSYDVLWLDKALTIKPETLQKVKKIQRDCCIVGYSPDDMYAGHSQSRQFLKHLNMYDVFFTTKSYNVSELMSLGCPRVEFVGKSFNPNLHRPLSVYEEECVRLGGSVGFIGTAEKERAHSVAFLAEKGIRVKVWGNEWARWQKKLRGKFAVAGPSQYGEQYTKIICSFDINLGFLRKINRDQQTSRSIEIPACGAFMLAERTREHLELFEEGKEAEFFSSNEELLDKVRFYLAHPQQRKRIAAAGRRRCLESGYSNHDRLKWMLEKVVSLR